MTITVNSNTFAEYVGIELKEIIMARARNIKPAFFQNEDLAELKPIERLAFIAMWTVADYRGCIEYRAKRLKVQLLPYDNCDIDTIVTNLEQSRFITTYNVNGQNYIKILNFEKHQNPHPNEKKAGSTIPDIGESNSNINELQIIVTNHDKDGTNRADSLIPITDSPLPITNTEVLEDYFEDFWYKYPKKVGKEAARKAWNKANPDIIKVIDAINWQRETRQWQAEDGKYIPNPATYLNQGRWMDEAPEQAAPF
jgi:uncharacterized protein YlbG (UPF0298 family)